MLNQKAVRSTARRLVTAGAIVSIAGLGLVGCAAGGGGATDDEEIGVALIVKTNSNPFFIAMQDGAQAAAESSGVHLTLAAGKEDGDEDTQIKVIEDAIARGDQGILITPNGPGVNDALVKARMPDSTSSRLTRRPTRPTRSTSPSRPTTTSLGSSSASGRQLS